MDIKTVNLINFGSELSEEVIRQIEDKHNFKIEQIRIKASLNLKKHSVYIQVHDLVQANKKYFTENVIVNLPGLPIFSAFLMVEIHALTGKFPVILECVKDFDENNIFSKYIFKRLYDCDRERSQSRENYKNKD